MTNFVSLHNQTEFSILDSLISLKDLFNQAKELNQTAIAVTDHGTLAAAYPALKVSRDTGIKLIIGCELYFQENCSEKLKHIVLLAKNSIGYRNLLILNKTGFDHDLIYSKRTYSVITWELLEKYSEGLICLTACGNGIISQLLMNNRADDAEQALLKLKAIFGDNLGLEVQPNNMKRGSNTYNDEIDQKFLNRQLINLGKKHNIKVVPTCNAHYIKKEDYEVHDALLAIGSHQPIHSNFRLKYPVEDFYLKSADEIKTFFTRNYGEEYAEELCNNSVYFADLCEKPEWIDPKFSNPSGKELPVFDVNSQPDYEDFIIWKSNRNEDLEDDKLYLRYCCERKLYRIPQDKLQEYKDRLEVELDVLYYCGVTSYVLIVADYVNWCLNNNILVGPGRGSAGGSLVTYLLGIHHADPIKYGLVFERFHSKQRESYSDIDLDFPKKDRQRVIDYISNKYGKDNVCQISTVMDITPKVYAKDVSRSCELGGSRESAVIIGNSVADIIPVEIGSIESAIKNCPIFVEYCKRYPEFLKYKEICNKHRSLGIHPSGVIISKRPLTGLVPLRKDKNGVVSIEYDKDVSEENGLVKMDVLGLNTLDVIDETNELIIKAGKQVPVIDYDLNDEKTYDLISSGNTLCVFQLGTSGGTIELCRSIKPRNIEDLAIIMTLARPAAKDIRESFIKTRNGSREVSLFHPLLKRALENTCGFLLYDESLQIMAKDVAGWDLGDADKLRKLTKEKGKNPEKVELWKKEFIEGAVKNGLHEVTGRQIWENVIARAGAYLFCKSHSVFYSMLAYHTAYLKTHFPVEFLLANLMSEINANKIDSKAKVERIKKEIRSYKIKILPPDINESKLSYSVLDNKKLLTGLSALKYVSNIESIQNIIENRPFTSFFDFMLRVDSGKVRSNVIQALASASCFDSFNIPRKLIYLYCSDYRKKLQTWLKKHDPTKEEFIYPWANEGEWSIPELYALEHFYLGEAFVCAPYKAYGIFFDGKHNVVSDIKKSKDKTNLVSVKAIVRDFFEFKVKKDKSKYFGQPMVKATIEDMTGDQCTCTIFPDRWADFQKYLKIINKNIKFEPGIAIHFGGTTNSYDGDTGIILEKLYSIAPIPSLPEDKKARKINLRAAKKADIDKTEEKSEDNPPQFEEIFEEIEDSLFDSGFLDFEEEDKDD